MTRPTPEEIRELAVDADRVEDPPRVPRMSLYLTGKWLQYKSPGNTLRAVRIEHSFASSATGAIGSQACRRASAMQNHARCRSGRGRDL